MPDLIQLVAELLSAPFGFEGTEWFANVDLDPGAVSAFEVGKHFGHADQANRKKRRARLHGEEGCARASGAQNSRPVPSFWKDRQYLAFVQNPFGCADRIFRTCSPI